MLKVYLLLYKPDTSAPERIILESRDAWSIGRSRQDNQIIVSDPSVSRHHCTIVRIFDSKSEPYGVYYRLFNCSRNGTCIESHSISTLLKDSEVYDLQSGDKIYLANSRNGCCLEFVLNDTEDTLLPDYKKTAGYDDET